MTVLNPGAGMDGGPAVPICRGVTEPHINRIATAVPRNEVHGAFQRFADRQITDEHTRSAFERLAQKSQIDRRFSVLEPRPDDYGTTDGFYEWGRYPSTGVRMARFEADAPALAEAACDALGMDAEGPGITHLILATCTGFAAPGLDHWLIRRYGIRGHVERTVVGFMGCQAAINALKLARQAVRSDPAARVLVVNIELCSLHLQPSNEIDQLMCFLLFADGCSAALVTAESEGLRMDGFRAALMPEARDHIRWRIGDSGFDMTLSGLVPLTLARALPEHAEAILDGAAADQIGLWAVHPGGRSVLDAVENGLCLPDGTLDGSRAVLRENGNMSSCTVMFALKRLMAHAQPGQRGCAMAFGPGLSAETMRFTAA